ncbi:MAG: GWxTD domain-containing protein [Gemmatimonadota bacterium]|nr:GWxTD domain-containing protein [Gemmatimonadota bacterium]
MKALSLLILTCLIAAPAWTSEVDSLYHAALSRMNEIEPKESVEEFKQVLKKNGKHAPALAQLTRLYIRLDTPEFRRRAVEASEKAIRIEPENLQYQLLHGEALWNRGFQREAKAHYEKVIEKFPNAAVAAYDAGRHIFGEYMITRDRVIPQRRAIRTFAKNEYDQAVMLFEKSLETDPDYQDSYYLLGLAHLEHRRIPGMQRVMRRMMRRFPGDINAQLFMAYSHQLQGNLPEANKLYEKAIAAMDPEQRKMMESVDIIASKEDSARIAKAMQVGDDGEWKDSAALTQFWNKNDPLFLTDHNERRMEHYGRVAYANLRFSVPARNIEGWKTIRGQTYIKYGKYQRRTTGVYPMFKETWYYDGYHFVFQSVNGVDGWGFAGEVGPSSTVDVTRAANRGSFGSSPRRSRSSRPRSSIPRSQRILDEYYDIQNRAAFKKVEARFVDPFHSRKYTLPHQITAFRTGKNMRMEIAYAIPTNKLKANDDQMIVVDDGLFMFDYLWRDIYRKVRPLGQKRPSGKNAQQYLLSQRAMTLPQGTYNVVVEVGDRISGSIGTFRTERLLTVSESSLDMSDLLLAQKIELVNPFPEKRTDLRIAPNPLRAYRAGQLASVYLEIYNLKKDEFGRTQYQIVYSISVPEKAEVDPSMFGAIDLTELDGLLIVSPPGQSTKEQERANNEKPASGNAQTRTRRANLRVRYVLAERNQMAESLEELRRAGQQSSTSISSVYAGDKSDDFTFLEIDLSTMPRGIYKLEVAITDLKAKKQVKRNAVFRVRE